MFQNHYYFIDVPKDIKYHSSLLFVGTILQNEHYTTNIIMVVWWLILVIKSKKPVRLLELKAESWTYRKEMKTINIFLFSIV